MDIKYHVRFTGLLQTGMRYEDVVSNLVNLTNLDREKAEMLLASGKPLVLKRDLDLETAEKYRAAFEKAGMVIQVKKTGAPVPSLPAMVQTETPRATTLPPENPGQRPPADTPPPVRRNLPEDPYAVPRSDLKVKRETKGQRFDQPQKVSASRGWYWLKSAVSLFFERPWIWMGMWVVFLLLITILNLVPFVGPLCAGMLGAVLSGGLMLAAQSQIDGQQVKVGHVFRGFSHNTNQLLLVGLYYILVFVVFGIILTIVMGVGFLSAFRSGDPGAVAAAMRENMPLIILLFLLMTIFAVSLMMAYWFAPALAALAGETAWNAYKLSYRGCLKNWTAFLLFSLALLVIGIIFLIVFSVVSGVLTYFLFHGGSILAVFLPMVIMAILGVPLAAILGLSVFTGFKDIYYQSA